VRTQSLATFYSSAVQEFEKLFGKYVSDGCLYKSDSVRDARALAAQDRDRFAMHNWLCCYQDPRGDSFSIFYFIIAKATHSRLVGQQPERAAHNSKIALRHDISYIVVRSHSSRRRR
jgi:hypothetical protein